MLNILYTIIIYPLVQIIEFVYLVGYKVFENKGFAIICVSFAVTFLCLPLYIVAEKWQNVERETYRRLKPKIDKIKAVFKGDEQYMILSTFFRQNQYHPLYALRSSFGILIQIPFFIAAYTFLSNLDSLKWASFYFIRDLRAPDGLLSIGGININVLPLVMTAINCIGGAIYSRNLFKKDRIQIYGTAAVFLILLYNSPSGLVLYWTINNILSLAKNIFFLLKKPLFVLYIILCAIVALVIPYLFFFHHGDFYKRAVLIAILLVIPFLPLAAKLYRFLLRSALSPLDKNQTICTFLFVLSQGIICLLLGFVIPSGVIASSPQEFSYIESVASPFVFLRNTFFQSLGFSIFWPLCIYFLFGNKVKTGLCLFSIFFCFNALLNTFVFPGSYGEFTGMLNFINVNSLKPSLGIALLNIFSLLLVCSILVLIISKDKMKIIISVSSIIIIAFIGSAVINSVKIHREFRRYTVILAAREEAPTSIKPIFNLSKEGKNVVIIMLDRAVNVFIPEIFSESQELYNQFSGFTWYPNTLSFNCFTLIGAPPLFGGYEYSPRIVNSRSEESLVKKHNESLLLMPVIFNENNFDVTVTDPPWANYSWIPDTRIYEKYPEIKVKNTLWAYLNLWISRNSHLDLQIKSQILKRNFIWFSLFKSVPMVIRPPLYNSGDWWSTNLVTVDLNTFLNNYAVLDLLPELTGADSPKLNTFLLLQNDLPHNPIFLQAPDYVPAINVTDRGNSKYADIINYPVNAAALKRIGVWFEYLKQQDLYDNTRIIIVSDHGADIDSGAFPQSKNIPFNRDAYNPLLLIKDFDADFPFKTDNAFMTNADVPVLAFEGFIENPVNPFTGNPVDTAAKQLPLHITISKKWMPNDHNPNTFKIGVNEWYSVHSDIFNSDNWQKLDK
ncbi:MAG: YidC/Oxa1 family membrane protein insertase [Treponema sp.]|jgi:YidC/Oxa1 family membrane protein insertase|nr:YidC/Oxa1 family membrane protein insertase [Treponema sp.]